MYFSFLLRKLHCFGKLLGLCLLAHLSQGQALAPAAASPPANAAPTSVDVADVARRFYARVPAHDSLGLQPGHRALLLVPVVGY